MLDVLQFSLVIVIFITTCLFIFYSILSRRQNLTSSLYSEYRARMNIHMGISFLALACLQLTLPSAYVIRYFLIGFIFIVGLINLTYGIKRYNWIKKANAKKVY